LTGRIYFGRLSYLAGTINYLRSRRDMINFNKLDTRAMSEVTVLVKRHFADERYTDASGVVWVGQGDAPDEVWVVESGSDEGYLNKNEMLLKMVCEITEGMK